MTESRFIQAADGTRIAYRIHGSGEPTVVLSNGIGCNELFLRYLTADLAVSHRVIEWHYRGHIDSEVGQDLTHLDFPHLLDDLDRVLADAGVERAVLAGFSMGVEINFEIYRRHPDLVQGLVAICGTYEYCLKSFFGVPVLQYLFPLILHAVRRAPDLVERIWRATVGGPLAFPLARLFIFNTRRVKRADFELYHPHITSLDPRCFLEMGGYLGRHSARDLLPFITVPTLVIAGTRDNFTPLRVSRQMARRIPGARLVEIKGGSHGTPIEFPDEVNAAVRQFLEEVTS